MVIGDKGERIKRIGTETRVELEQARRTPRSSSSCGSRCARAGPTTKRGSPGFGYWIRPLTPRASPLRVLRCPEGLVYALGRPGGGNRAPVRWLDGLDVAARRVRNEPAYVLHRYDSERVQPDPGSAYTREHGRIALVAKGAKRPSSGFRPGCSCPCSHCAWPSAATPRSAPCKGAEWQGGHVMPAATPCCRAITSTSSLLALLARDDPHRRFVRHLRCRGPGDWPVSTARRCRPPCAPMNCLLLREVGLLPQLDVQTMTSRALRPSARYTLVPEGGLRLAAAPERAALSGTQWAHVQAALKGDAPFTTTLRVCAGLRRSSSPSCAPCCTTIAASPPCAPGG